MAELQSAGRPRLFLLVLLVLLIGAAGALTLAPLIHEGPVPPARGDAAVTVAAPGGGALAGVFHLTATGEGRPPLDLQVPIEAGTRALDVAVVLAERCREAGWEDTETLGSSVHLSRVSSVGAGAGTTGLGVTTALAAHDVDGNRFRLRVARETGASVAERLNIVAAGRKGPGAREVNLEIGARERPESVLLRLGKLLAEEGWSIDHPTPEPDHVDLETLPFGHPLEQLMLTYGLPKDAPPAAATLTWTVEVR